MVGFILIEEIGGDKKDPMDDKNPKKGIQRVWVLPVEA